MTTRIRQCNSRKLLRRSIDPHLEGRKVSKVSYRYNGPALLRHTGAIIWKLVCGRSSICVRSTSNPGMVRTSEQITLTGVLDQSMLILVA